MFGLIRGIWRFLVALAEGLRKTLTVVFMLVLIGVIVIVVQGGPPITIEDNVALVVAPSGILVEYDDVDPRERVLDEILGEPPAQMAIGDLITAIETAADDARIASLFLKLDEGFAAGQAQLEEIGVAIEQFKQSGKPVHAWAPALGQAEYFLAAHADKIWIDPMGAVFLPGFEVDNLYFAEALKKLGVKVHVFREGRYKSAVEPFSRDSMSAEARANANRWLSSLWQQWKAWVASKRGAEPEQLQNYTDNLIEALEAARGDLAKVAVDAGLVTAALPLSEVRTAVAELVGRDPDHGSFRQVHFRRYLQAQRGRKSTAMAAGSDKVIALVHVQGEIVDGEGVPGQAGGDLIRSLIEDARLDDSVAALVLRVDSPGGSVTASEQIRRAVLDFQATGRPVVASMGSVAASGGYWVSMDADNIVAAGTTITGSIGVFGLLPTLEKGMDKLGVHPDGTGTTVWAGAFNPARPLAATTERALKLVIGHDYREFLQAVATGRELSVERVEEIASGQVWSGAQALELGLVDAIGDYTASVEAAAKLAELDPNVPVEIFAPEVDVRLQVLRNFSSRLGWEAPDWLRSMTGLLQAPVAPRLTSARYAHCFCDNRGASAPSLMSLP